MKNSSHNLEDNCDSFSHEFFLFFACSFRISFFYFCEQPKQRPTGIDNLCLSVWMSVESVYVVGYYE